MNLLWILAGLVALVAFTGFRRRPGSGTGTGIPGAGFTPGYTSPSDSIRTAKPVVFDGTRFISRPTPEWAQGEYAAEDWPDRYATALAAWNAVNGEL